jgi:hypothetical protein
MGKQLMKLYDLAKEEGGIQTQMRLALRSGVPPARAAEIEDTQELIERFKKLISEILGKNAK